MHFTIETDAWQAKSLCDNTQEKNLKIKKLHICFVIVSIAFMMYTILVHNDDDNYHIDIGQNNTEILVCLHSESGA